MSGQQQVSFHSEYYRFIISGGISSWNYEQMRARDKALESVLLVLKPELDECFAAIRNERQLNSLIDMYDPNTKYFFGAVIEADAREEAINQHQFTQYRNSNNEGRFNVDHERWIDGTSFKVVLGLTVTDRIKRTDLDAILDKQIDTLKNSPTLMDMLY